jgi:hypothetical protein
MESIATTFDLPLLRECTKVVAAASDSNDDCDDGKLDAVSPLKKHTPCPIFKPLQSVLEICEREKHGVAR